MLDFRNLKFSSSNLRVRAIMPQNSKFRLNWTIWSRVIAKNDFQYGVRPPSWVSEFRNFCHVSVALLNIACAYQISSNSDDSRLRYGVITIFKMAAVRHVGFSKFDISSPNLCTRVIKLPNSKFRLNRTIWSRVIAKKYFQYGVRPPSWICEFLKFSHISVAWVKVCVGVPNFVTFGQFAAEIWRYNDFQNGSRPPCWIYWRHHIVQEDWF